MSKKKNKGNAGGLRGYVERLPGVFVLEAWALSPRLMRAAGNWCGVGGPYLIPGRGAYMAKEYKEATKDQYRIIATHATSEGKPAVLVIENKTDNDAFETSKPDTGSDSGAPVE